MRRLGLDVRSGKLHRRSARKKKRKRVKKRTKRARNRRKKRTRRRRSKTRTTLNWNVFMERETKNRWCLRAALTMKTKMFSRSRK